MGDDEEKGKWDTPINKARPVRNLEEQHDQTIRKSDVEKDKKD